MENIVTSLITQLELDNDQITNIYNYGSWVYGTNHEGSDRDFLIVIKNTDKYHQESLKFHDEIDYFHQFKLYQLDQCDITIHSCENFELLLEKHYLLAIECLFYPSEFILRNQIDYKTIYLTKYFNPLRLKQVAFYENLEGFQCIIENKYDDGYLKTNEMKLDQFICNICHFTTKNEDRVLKYLFHSVRYLDIVEQLLRLRTIENFKRSSFILFEIKEIFLKNNRNIDDVVDYIQEKSIEYKILLDQLVPTDNINGSFQIQVTINDDHNIDQFLNFCQMNQFKLIYIQFGNDNSSKQLIISIDRFGTYPNLIEEIQTIFKNIDIKRLKIKSLITNNNIPENDINHTLFWNKISNYFEFHYKVTITSGYDYLELICFCKVNDLYLTKNILKEPLKNGKSYFITMLLFNIGKTNALYQSKEIIEQLRNRSWCSLIDIEEYFIVYDSNINLSKISNNHRPIQLRYTSTNNRRYRIGCFQCRKVYRSS